MIFDLFHSIADPVVAGRVLGPQKTVAQFLSQAKLAEALGCDTVWLAESHFSSQTQKKTSVATIPDFYGEVGMNCDSFQFFHLLQSHTKKIHLGTGIHNIVGGSGGPIASAERVNFLHFLNQEFWGGERVLRMGIASGRFPFQNTPFGLIPRNALEKDFWPILKRTAFIEAVEIFLRLLRGEELSSEQTATYEITEKMVSEDLKKKYSFPLAAPKRWLFESLKLNPVMKDAHGLEIVLGSGDPEALQMANRYWDVDLFNLSFTPPEQIEKLHSQMSPLSQKWGSQWKRSRLPRTVLVFIDPNAQKAEELAHFVLDTYIEAMRGTAQVPDKKVLMERALIGDAAQIRDQLHPDNPRRFNPEDRLMLWFEFNQLDGLQIEERMKYFFKEVAERI